MNYYSKNLKVWSGHDVINKLRLIKIKVLIHIKTNAKSKEQPPIFSNH